MTRFPAFAGMTTALLLSACGDMPLVSNPSDRTVARLEIDLAGTSFYTGEAAPLRWSLFDQHDEPIDLLPGWLGPSWSSTQPIVRLTGNSIEPIEPGQTTLTLTFGSAVASEVIRINPGNLKTEIKAAYVTQPVQRLDGSLPLVAGKPGMLRVFVTGDQLNFFAPTVRAKFYRNGSEFANLTATAAQEGIPETVAEGFLQRSWNIPLDASIIAPGTFMAVEVLSDGGLRTGTGSVLRFPPTGTRALNVRVVPVFRITFVPIDIVGLAVGNVTAANVENFFSASRQVWPFGETDVVVREPYTTTTRSLTDVDWENLLHEIEALRLVEGAGRYYHGILRREGAWAGLGFINRPAAISMDVNSAWTVAHELGHNFGRRHAPCGGPDGVDPNYPHSGGGIGVYGLERDNITVHPPNRYDLMTYCTPRWVSDYNYLAVVNKLAPAAGVSASASASAGASAGASASGGRESVTSLIVSGKISSTSGVISPAFTTQAQPSIPTEPGPFTLEGRDAGGASLFSLSFAGESLGDGPGDVRHFVFAIPMTEAQQAALVTLRLTGPGVAVERSSTSGGALRSADAIAGSEPTATVTATGGGRVLLEWDASRYPLVVVRNPASGSVLSMARGGRATLRTGAPELELNFSDGVRSFRRLLPVR